MELSVKSPAFSNDGTIPQRFTGDGEDVSPALSWSGVPSGVQELALIMDDPDAPTPQPWVHWVIYKIPASVTALPEAVPTTETVTEPPGVLQGRNSFGKIGYGGPAPPPGPVHHYHFKLFALDEALTLSAGLTKSELLAAIEGHIVAQGELVGTYRR